MLKGLQRDSKSTHMEIIKSLVLHRTQNIMMGRDGNVMDRKSINNMFVELHNLSHISRRIVAALQVLGDVKNALSPMLMRSI